MEGRTVNPADFIGFIIRFQGSEYPHLWYMLMLLGMYLMIPVLRLFVKRENKKYIAGIIIALKLRHACKYIPYKISSQTVVRLHGTSPCRLISERIQAEKRNRKASFVYRDSLSRDLGYTLCCRKADRKHQGNQENFLPQVNRTGVKPSS